ncbi:MAG: VOC family protein [Candidatus Micrarchaeota archaeon]|nr:VOC family protein [Candidatus Micrarchaeota archaeon]
MQGITPFLWFVDNAEEAARFYVSIFKDSKLVSNTRVKDTPSGVDTYVIELMLHGTRFLLFNGGKAPGFDQFSPATSFVLQCKTQKEIDYYWGRLLRGGKSMQCGWLTDKYGIAWQVIPTFLPKLLNNPKNKEGSARATQAMLKMVKLDIQKLKDAYSGK